jgi:hypothetical protein
LTWGVIETGRIMRRHRSCRMVVGGIGVLVGRLRIQGHVGDVIAIRGRCGRCRRACCAAIAGS